MTPLPAVPETLLPLGRRVGLVIQGFASTLMVAVIASLWGRWSSVAVVVVIWGVAALGNMAIAIRSHRLGYERGDNLRAVLNVAIHPVIGIVCGWSFVSWLVVPLAIATTNLPPSQHGHRRVLAVLLAMDAIALATGARWRDALAWTAVSLFVHTLIDAYLAFAGNLLRDQIRMLHELEAAQQAVLAQEKFASIGQLAAGIAHEINNPMCFITANTEALLQDLQDEPALPPRLAEYRDAILAETLDGILRVNAIVGDLRRFARGEPEQMVEFDLSAEVIASVRLARTLLKADQRLHIEVVPELRIVGMPRQIAQAVLNLIVNALHALDCCGGDVWVTTADRGDHVTIAVKDSGVGMSNETVGKLFQPFFTSKPAGAGVGLGLAVAYGIVVQAHRGHIQVESAQGRGSCFTITLPRAPDGIGLGATPAPIAEVGADERRPAGRTREADPATSRQVGDGHRRQWIRRRSKQPRARRT